MTTGTKEWAAKNINCMKGCSNDCRYCYAKRMALRYHRIQNADEWKKMIPNLELCEKYERQTKFNKSDKTIMFPSSHDLPFDLASYWIPVLFSLVKSENKVLVVTKANLKSIIYIIQRINDEGLSQFRNNLEFRITITALDESIREFWEPGAPTYQDRIAALKLLYEHQFKTSVSIEPILTQNICNVIKEVKDYSDTIWIGKMNHMLCVLTDPQNDLERVQYDKILDIDRGLKYYMKHVIDYCKNAGCLDKIKWKDSMLPTFIQLTKHDQKISKYMTMDRWMPV